VVAAVRIAAQAKTAADPRGPLGGVDDRDARDLLAGRRGQAGQRKGDADQQWQESQSCVPFFQRSQN